MTTDIPYYKITYKLSERVGNTYKPFERTRDIYTAEISADSSEQAQNCLRDMFSMLTVNVLSVSDKMTMSREEYENS